VSDTSGAERQPYRLARHVPRIALDWVVDTPDERWKLVEGSMVFADISGFTALSERLATRGRIGAEELVETLSRVFGAMLDTAASRGGQLLKFGGDALLFLFTGDAHPVQACSTAVEMRQELRRASEIRTSVGRLNLKISTGVHSGAFHMCLVGEPHRELVVLGPGTTEAVSCENAANAGEIVVSADTAALIAPGSVRPRDDGHLLLRWRQAPVGPSGRPDLRDTDAAAAHQLMPRILADVLEGARPDPAHRVATISFMRFSGTDQILEAEGPDALADKLHETLRIAQAAFVAEDVALLCVDCDVGAGKFFCSSGVPLTSEDDEGRMLRAAKAILAADPPLPLQIGINRGHVFAAEVGIPYRAAFSAMGDTTNTAARICGKAPQGSIYVHPAVLDHARTLYEAEPVGPFVFKGKTQPQVLYDVGEEIGTKNAARSHELPLMGRNAELAVLRDALASVVVGRGGVVVVSGAVGLGKSRLVREALAEVDDVPVLAVHAEPYGSTSAYRVFRDPLRSLLGVERGSQTAMAQQLRDAVRRLSPELEPYLSLLADVVQVEVTSTADVDAIAPQFRPDRTADVVVTLLSVLHPGPLVVVTEDAHWVDEASAHLLGRLSLETRVRPWLVLVVRRSDEGGFVPDDATSIELLPLESDVIRDMAIAVTEAAPLRPHEIDLVVSRSAGNPLFVGELIRVAQELGSLESVPESLQGTMAAQVDALDPLARRVLSYASVLGRSFRRSVLAEVLRREDLRLDSATVERLGRFLEADGADRFRFRNGLLRDVTYEGLGYRLRSRLHLEAGLAVERLSSDLAADADTLSLHFALGGDHERTYRYALLAAERATRAHVNVEAAVQLERAIDAARRLPEVADDDRRQLWIDLGDARDRAAFFDAALEAYHRAAALTRDDAITRAELHLRRAKVRERAGAFSIALREATRSASIAAAIDSDSAGRLRAQAAAFRALLRQRQERAAEALRVGREAAVVAADCDDKSALARAYNVISWASLVLGRDDSATYAERALDLYEQSGDLAGQADMANNLGIQAYFEGRWDETLERYFQSQEACRRVGNAIDAATTEANIGEVLVNQGRLDEAEPLLRNAQRVLRSSGYEAAAAFAEMHLGRLITARGDLHAAETMLRGTLEQLTRMGRTASAYETSLHLADCLVRLDQPGDAMAVIALAARHTSDDMSILDASRALVVARALNRMGLVDEALETIAEGVVHARRRVLDFDLARLLLLAARLGEPYDPRLGTTEPAEEAHRLLDRLGVVSTVSA
jgi:predicted ATPase/class 3 adenylate cyclase